MNGSGDSRRPSAVQRNWLQRGLTEPGGKLPLFDKQGQQIDPRTIRACIEQGWAEPWFANPAKPGWLVCKLTPAGRDLARGRAAKVDLISEKELISSEKE